MELHVFDKDKLIDIDFGFWLIPKIRAKLISSYKDYHFDNWDTYLNTSPDIKRMYSHNKYNVFDILLEGAYNLVCEGTSGDIRIFINKNNIVSGYDRLNLERVLKTINYGTLSIKACPIVSNVFAYFAEDIVSYARQYYQV